MNNKQPEKVKFWDEVKNTFKSKSDKKEFPWLQSGFVLVGFTLGIVATSIVTMTSINLDTVEQPVQAEASEEEKCVDQGGRYDRNTETCNFIASDRGESCKDNSDCDGWCLVDDNAELGEKAEGSCSNEYTIKGCVKFMDDGKVNSICLPE